MADNLDPNAGNQDPNAGQSGDTGDAGQVSAAQTGAPSFSWKTQLSPDVMNSPTMQKFSDDKDGLLKAVTSHLELEKLLGHEKVPIPKGPEDAEGWARFNKAMGIPDKADGYGLPDAQIPENMQGMVYDKAKFAETVHQFKLTPSQAKGLWGAYTEMIKGVYSQAQQAQQAQMTQVINQMRSEWGDAYDSNVELGQMVINKFSSDKGMEDFVTATLAKSPMGIKFLSKIGSQFAENKIGDFKYSRFSLTPDQAQSEIDSILRDSNHPYNSDKASQAERDKAIDYVNSLYKIKAKANG